jgi:hypothetical protein
VSSRLRVKLSRILSLTSNSNPMIPFMISLKMLEDQNPQQPGVPLYLIYQGLETMVTMQIQRYQSGSEIQGMIADALKDGLLSKIPTAIDGPANLFRSTEDYYDLVLFIGGRVSFKNLLFVAGQDTRFNELFKNVGAKAPSS